MAQIEAQDERNYVMLASAHLPEMEQIKAAWPRSPKFLRAHDHQFAAREEAAAFTVTALARRLAYYRRAQCGGLDAAMTIPLDTWLIGPSDSPNSTFAGWYDDEPRDTSLRILIHRKPVQYKGVKSPGLWAEVYRDRKLGLKRCTGPFAHLKRAVRPFLNKMLQAYRTGTEAVHSLMRQTGHPYCYASWLPDRSTYRHTSEHHP